jgi:SAM-dependent methyltransferase
MSVFEAEPSAEYVFDPGWDKETERLRTNEALWDPGTIARFDRIGVAAGWSCLEVGAGNGSAAGWLADRVGPGGRVVATDLEVDRLEWLSGRPQTEVWRHDLRTEDLPADTFDLIHCRMVIQHLPDREAAVARLARALRPGGTLFLEDTDSLPLFRSYLSTEFLQDIREAGYGLMAKAGHEPRGGHFDLQAALGLGLDATAEGRVVMVRGGSLQARHYVLWLEYMRPKIVEAGLLGDERIDEAQAEMADPANFWLSQILISTVARRPGGRR